tara:strand:- start:2715 stop:3017 length:303 start_codon:yes stop_codon:yes gene_type:complete
MSYLDKFNFDEITTWDLKQVNQTVQHAVKLALPFLLAEIEPHIGFMIKEQLKEIRLDDEEAISEALKHTLQEGWVDSEIEERISTVLSNGSVSVDLEFSA